MKLICAVLAIAFSSSAFANPHEINCSPTNSKTWLQIEASNIQANQKTTEVGTIRILRVMPNQSIKTLTEITNANLAFDADENGFATSVQGDLGRSGAFQLQLHWSADGTGFEGKLVSTIFAPGLNFPKGVNVTCSQTSPRPALSGSN